MPATTPTSPRLEQARATHRQAVEQLRTAAEAIDAAGAGADLDALQATFDTAEEAERSASATVDREVRLQRARSIDVPDDAAPGDVRVTREPVTYDRHELRQSYFLDLARVHTGRGDVDGARSRLARHSDETRDEVERRRRWQETRMSDELQDMLADSRLPDRVLRAIEPHLVEKRAISRVDGSGGDFVPPVWLLDEYAAAARAGRPFADACRNIPLPQGTDSINVPRITSGTVTASQTGDGAAVSSVDMTTATVTAPVKTIAGQQDIALQLLEQSPIGFDQIVFDDLMADYALQLDTQCLNGSGAAGQLLGLLNTVGVNAVTYTDGTPTFPELAPKLADALNQVSTNRKAIATHYWWHPRRWYWASGAQLDASNRPFFTSLAGGPNNSFGAYPLEFENQGGPVTYIQGTPVFLDLSLPVNLGAGTNEDRIVATRMRDHVLFEGDLRARAMSEVLSGTLQVRLQVYAYCAFTAGRFPAASSVIAGTGLVTPTF